MLRRIPVSIELARQSVFPAKWPNFLGETRVKNLTNKWRGVGDNGWVRKGAPDHVHPRNLFRNTRTFTGIYAFNLSALKS